MARLLPRFSSNDSPDARWIHRVTENLRAAFLLPKYVRSSSNGAPLHFADIDLSARRGSAQACAAIVHATLLCAVLLPLNSPHGPLRPDPFKSVDTSKIQLRIPHFLSASGFGRPSLGPEGGSGNNDLRPPTRGNLAPLSSMPLTSPRIPQSQDAQLPVPPAVFDANAPASVPVVTKLGLPWMKDDSDSSGSVAYGPVPPSPSPTSVAITHAVALAIADAVPFACSHRSPALIVLSLLTPTKHAN